MKEILKDNIRLTYGFDVEKLIPETKVIRTLPCGFQEFMWVKECTPERLWLKNRDGICYMNHDYYTAEQYHNSNVEIKVY